MKQLYGKLWVKCTAIALLVVFAVLFAAAALGSAYLIRYGAFADGGEQVVLSLPDGVTMEAGETATFYTNGMATMSIPAQMNAIGVVK